ncbi:hypothetical protein HK102_009769 [Quaeritorhiza haematococci]|nr:hypothetical protein HK102_009769 [Quaeritorhiza haematococci]
MPSPASSSSSLSSSRNPARQLKLNNDLLDMIMPYQTLDIRREYAQLKNKLDKASYRLDCLHNASRGLVQGSLDAGASCKDYKDMFDFWSEHAKAHTKVLDETRERFPDYADILKTAYAYTLRQCDDFEDGLTSQEVTADLLNICSNTVKTDIEVWKAKHDEADAAYALFLKQFWFDFDPGDGNGDGGGDGDEEHRKRRRLQLESTIPDPSTVECVVCSESGQSQSFLICGHTLCTQCLKNVVVTSHRKGERDPRCHLCRKPFKKALVGLPVELKYHDQFVQVPLKLQDVEIYLDTRHVLQPFTDPDQWRFGAGRFRVVPFGLHIDEGLDCGDLVHWEDMVVEKEASKVWSTYLADVADHWEAELRGEVVEPIVVE